MEWDADPLQLVAPESTSSEQPGDDTPSEDVSEPTPGKHQAALMMAGQSFTFNPTQCVIANNDVKVSGPGVDDADKSPVFLDIDIGEVDGWPEGKAFVYFNAGKPAPTDVFFEGQVGGGDNYSMGNMLDGYELEVFFRNHDAVPTGTGTFLISCG